MSNENMREDWVDYAKGIAIILVVYGHVTGGARLSNIDLHTTFLFVRSVIYDFHMPLFFFLSGLFVQQSFIKRGLKEFIVHKIRIIVYPYFIWSFLQGLSLVFISKHSYLDYSLSDVFLIVYQPIQHFWFLYSLFIMYCVFAFTRTINDKLTTSLLLVSFILFVFPVPSSIASMDRFSVHFLFFVLGAFYKTYSLDIFFEKKSSISYAGLSLLIFASVEAAFGENDMFLFRIVTALSGIAMSIILAKYFARKRIVDVLRKAGYYSMPIYLIHGFSGSGTRIILHNYLGLRNAEVVVIISTVAGIGLSMFMYQFAMRSRMKYLFQL